MTPRSRSRARFLVVTAILFVFIVAGGCGSRSEEAAIQATPTLEAEAAQIVPSPTVAPTEQPTGEAQAAEPAGVAEEPTVPPTSVSEGDTTAASAPQAQEACSHPYYPVRDGALYRYRMSAPGMDPQEMTMSFSITGPDSFVTTQVVSGVTTETAWQCTPNGLLQTDFGISNLNVPGLEYTVDDMSGVTLPLPDQMVEGASWQSRFSMSGEMAMEGFAMKVNMEATTDSVLSRFEDVTTAAGTFNSARVDSTTTLELSTDMPGAPAMPAMNVSTTLWLSEGIGMVKSTTADPSGGTSTLELVAME